jgi:hypothetical protein
LVFKRSKNDRFRAKMEVKTLFLPFLRRHSKNNLEMD